MKHLASMLLFLAVCTASAAPPKEPAPTIEPTGPLRLARYTKPFAQAQPGSASRDFAARYTYGTPFYFYCGYPCGGYYGYGYGGYYGCGSYFYHPISYPYGAYYPSY